jgi:hypothetical protein
MFKIEKAERKKSRLLISLCGIESSGKTYSSILLAKGLGAKKIVIIDTESTRAHMHSALGGYDVCPLNAPFYPDRYVGAIEFCEKQGYEVIIIDSITHEWSGEGGVLEMVGEYSENHKTKSGKIDTFGSGWKYATPLHNKFVSKILNSKADIIATMRSKSETIVEAGIRKKIGLKPDQRDNLPYEFTVSFELETDNSIIPPKKIANITKSTANLLEEYIGKKFTITEETGRLIKEWRDSGSDNKVQSTFDLQTAIDKVNSLSQKEEIILFWKKEAKILESINDIESFNTLKKIVSYRLSDMEDEMHIEEKKSIIDHKKTILTLIKEAKSIDMLEKAYFEAIEVVKKTNDNELLNEIALTKDIRKLELSGVTEKHI